MIRPLVTLAASALLGACTAPTPKSLSIALPSDTHPFTGPSADLLNGRCIACHSASMVLVQPPMTTAQWRASVIKMRDVYKAPVDPEEVDALATALAALDRN